MLTFVLVRRWRLNENIEPEFLKKLQKKVRFYKLLKFRPRTSKHIVNIEGDLKHFSATEKHMDVSFGKTQGVMLWWNLIRRKY